MTTAAAAQAHPDAAAATAAAAAAAAATAQTPEQIAAAEKTAADAAAAKTAADAAAAETARLDAEAKAKLKAPEKYALAVPKGSELYVGDAELKAVEAKARAKALSNDAAQGLVDEIAEERAAVSAALRAETEADPTWGGEKLPETQRLANLALDAIWPKGTPLGDRVRDVLVRTGMANDLAIVSGLASWGKQMAEDTPIVGGARRADPGAKGGASLLYDHPTSKAVDAAGSS
jgi:hypothetical protein